MEKIIPKTASRNGKNFYNVSTGNYFDRDEFHKIRGNTFVFKK